MKFMNVLQLAEQCRKITPIEDSTWANWLKAMKPIADLPIAEINKAVVMQYRISQRKPDGPLCDTTYKQRIGTLKGIWNTAIEWELIEDYNPWMGADKRLPGVVENVSSFLNIVLNLNKFPICKIFSLTISVIK